MSKSVIIVLVSSLSVLVLGIITKWIALPMIIEDRVYKNLELIKGTKGYDVWVEPSQYIYRNFYFFHVLNTEDILSLGSKPHVGATPKCSHMLSLDAISFRLCPTESGHFDDIICKDVLRHPYV